MLMESFMKERGLNQYHQVYKSEITSDIVCLDVMLTPAAVSSTSIVSTVIQASSKSLVIHQLHGNHTTGTSMMSMSTMTVIPTLRSSNFMI